MSERCDYCGEVKNPRGGCACQSPMMLNGMDMPETEPAKPAPEPEILTRMVSAMEYEALLNVEKMVRLAMSQPKTGEFLVAAIVALDTVRTTESGELAVQRSPILKASASAVTAALIERAKRP